VVKRCTFLFLVDLRENQSANMPPTWLLGFLVKCKSRDYIEHGSYRG
jgi:hypothetical protein